MYRLQPRKEESFLRYTVREPQNSKPNLVVELDEGENVARRMQNQRLRMPCPLSATSILLACVSSQSSSNASFSAETSKITRTSFGF